MLNKWLLTSLASGGVLTAAALPAPLGVGGAGGWRLGQGLGTGQWTLGWHQVSCVSKFPTHAWSQAHSDNSATSLSPSVAYMALPTDSDYTMQEFALRYFRKPQTL